MEVQILKWTLVGLMALSALGNVILIGEERKPVTPGMAAFTVALNAAFITWIINVL